MSDPQTEQNRCVMHTEKIHELELGVVKIQSDVVHIREKLDNGFSTTIAQTSVTLSKVLDKINEMAIDRAAIKTKVEANTNFLDKMKSTFIWVFAVAGVGGAIGLGWRLVHQYITNVTNVI